MNTRFRNAKPTGRNISQANRCRADRPGRVQPLSAPAKIPATFGPTSGSADVAITTREAKSCPGLAELPAPDAVDHAVWSVVLAGGEGERLRPLMERWWGEHRPKQYCTFVGDRSMLRHTLDRAERLTGADRMLVVVANHHEPRAWDRLTDHHAQAIIAQPQNRDTAAGIFLPLTYIGVQDPEATVVILPSDHFVHPEDEFLSAVRRAVVAAQQLPDRLVLLGARPDNPETEYGWIQPGNQVGHIEGYSVRSVAGFREKPHAQEAQQLLQTGGLWNTLVIAAQWRTLWQLGWRCFPAMMERFEEFAGHVGTEKEPYALASVYDQLPLLNFSSGLLQRVPNATVVMELHQGMVWSDWGNEARIVETLNRIGKTPLFPISSPPRLIAANQVSV